MGRRDSLNSQYGYTAQTSKTLRLYHVCLRNTECATYLFLLVTFVPNIFICKGELIEWNKGLLEIPAVQLRSNLRVV